eukprot:TRINITY_DN3199_c1_g1_i4.p1 TRINITY_DN3199_c1_g1~~TRINITY_DN3199_c1_g1_i4.p1  ORF type:complete len:576 (+),score=145.18 TRINITY_DN3199_c1_g1_i4:878-2605(+)
MGSSSSVEKKNENRQEKKRLDSVTPGGVESGDADTFLETATVPEIKEAFRKLQSTYVEVQNSLMAEKATNAVLSGKVKGLEQLVHELQGDAVRLKADTSIPAGGPNLTPADEEGRKETERAAQLCACASGGNLDELQALLKTGINVNVVDYGKRTALHIACEEGHLEIVEALIGEGADINTKDRWGTTPLKAALTNVHNDVANVLKENGAVVEDKLLRSPSTITALFNERSRTFKQFVTGLEEFCRITLTDPIPLPGLCLFLFKEYGVNIAVNQLLFTEVVAAAKPSSESDDLKKWDTKKACLKTFKQLSSASHISVFSSIVGLLDKNKQLGHIVTREALRVAMAGSDTSDTVSMCKLAMAQGAISNWGAFVKMLDELCHEVMLGPNEGNNAAYIPNLAEGMVDPELFSVSVCTVEGQQFVFGDEEAFTLQSCGKPFIYAAALEEKGDEEVHKYVGTEPSGRQFDNFELANGKPFNPVTNAGCLVTGSMYKSTAENSERLSSYMDLVQDLAGNQDVKLDKKVFKSEQSTAYKNYAIANLLAAEGCFPDHIKKYVSGGMKHAMAGTRTLRRRSSFI